MKFIVKSTDLKKALNITKFGLTKKEGALIMTSCFIFRIVDDKLSIETSTGFSFVKHTIPITNISGEDTAFALWKFYIQRAVRYLDNQELEIEVFEYQIQVTHTYGHFSVPKMDCVSQLDDFKEKYQADEEILTIEAPCLLSVMRRCQFAMADDELRPAMNGVFMTITPKGTDFVASEGHKLVRVHKESIKLDKEFGIIFPSQMVNILIRTLPTTGFANLFYNHSKKYCKIVIEDTEYLFQAVDGRYPNYLNVIPEKFYYEFRADRKELMGCLNRIITFAPENSRTMVFDVYDNTMVLSTTDKDFETQATESLSVDYNSKKSIHTGFNCVNLLDIIKHLGSTEVIFKVVNQDTAIMIYPSLQPANEEVSMLLMPMLIADK